MSDDCILLKAVISAKHPPNETGSVLNVWSLVTKQNSVYEGNCLHLLLRMLCSTCSRAQSDWCKTRLKTKRLTLINDKKILSPLFKFCLKFSSLGTGSK